MATLRRFKILWTVVALWGALLLGLSATAITRSQPAEISLIARDMAFYLPDDPTPNPTLRVKPGQSVRLRFVNRDLGTDHDWVVASLGVRTRRLAGNGSAQTVTLEAPQRPGTHEYVCSLHDQMMRGRLIVAD